MATFDDLVQEKANLLAARMTTLTSKDVHWEGDGSSDQLKKQGFFPRDFGMDFWDWPQGVGLFGLARLQGNPYDHFIRNWAKNRISQGLPMRNINTTVPMLTLSAYPEYEKMALDWATDIYTKFPRTAEGGLEHFTTGADKNSISRNPGQLWADTIFMTVLFLAKMGQSTGNEQWLEEANYQTLLHIKYLLDPATGLFSHGWDFNRRNNLGRTFWGRGNCWLAYGLPLYLEMVGPTLAPAESRYLEVVISNQLRALFALQSPEHLWHTLLDDSSSYIEASGSAGILAGAFLALRLGILSDHYLDQAQAGLRALLGNVDEQGILHHVSAGTSLTDDRSAYKAIKQLPMAYGQALALCACAEYLSYKGKDDGQ